MIDPVHAAMLALTSQSPAAFGLVFIAGVVTSVGPCIAPRYIAIAAISNGDRRPLVPTAAFVAGLICAFMAVGFVTGLLGTLWTWSGSIYGLLAIGLTAGGCITLVRAAPRHSGDHGCGLKNEAASDQQRSLGAIFLLGATSAFVISPCCTPIVASVVATSTAIGKPLVGAALLFCYAAGHALPLFFAGSIGTLLRRIVPVQLSAQAPAIIGAVLMLALGMYYGLLA